MTKLLKEIDKKIFYRAVVEIRIMNNPVSMLITEDDLQQLLAMTEEVTLGAGVNLVTRLHTGLTHPLSSSVLRQVRTRDWCA